MQRAYRFINANARRPRGLMGRFLGWLWVWESRAINDKAIALLGLESGDCLLEIGFGPGETIRRVLARYPGLRIIGIESSDLMLKLARARNKDAISDGRLSLRKGASGGVAELGEVCTHALLVHCLYFLDDLQQTCERLSGALKSGGVLVIAAVVTDAEIPARFMTPAYNFRSTAEILTALGAAGMHAEVHQDERGTHGALRWFRATKT